MLFLLRIFSTLALIYCINQARVGGEGNRSADDLTSAGWLVGGVIVALICAASWAPLIGEKIADPLTGGLVNSPYEEPKNRLLRLIRWCDRRGYRKTVVGLCFLEGIRRPWLPMGFVIGMKAARPRSWFQKVYAREVFKFNNAENCITAYRILREHGIDPRPHKNTEINKLLLAENQVEKPAPALLKVEEKQQVSIPKRDGRIRIGKDQ